MIFQESFAQFIKDNGLLPEEVFAKVRLVPLEGFRPFERENDTLIYLYEDLWWSHADMIRKRLLAHFGQFRSIFARNCRVEKLSTPVASEFFDLYHTYGRAQSKYRYGLFLGDELVAAASFSFGRPMPREDAVVQSYEWIRYASLPDARIVGGMGKLLKAFIDDVHPEEVMSYADLEWSSGSVYRTLGFTPAGDRPPVPFSIDPHTFRRIRTKRESLASCTNPICNLGSRKYLKRIV